MSLTQAGRRTAITHHHQAAGTRWQISEEVMLTAPDVAREVSVSRRAEARESELISAARLARRQRRLERRIDRVNGYLAAHR